jgi:hypothetical protein
MKVGPMPAPKPALKYQLLPEVRELSPGNSAQNYLKCFAEQRNFYFGKEAVAERARYLSMPLAELPAEKLLDYGGAGLRQADWAARLDRADWQVLHRVQNDGVNAPPAEIGLLQLLAPALQVRFRAQVAGGHFDDATRTAKTMFAFAHHLGDYPATTANLLGLAVAQRAVGTLEEMVQQPSCPNLYWALSDLPCPLVDLRNGIQGDRSMTIAELAPLRDDVPMTDEQLERFVSRLSGKLGFAREQSGEAPRNLRTGLTARVKDGEKVRAARARLVAAGGAEELLAKFPPAQIILLDDRRDYEIRRDDAMKLLALACWQIDGMAGTAQPGNGGEGLFAELLPDVVSCRREQGLLEQRIALLRHVEALRLFAADHDGHLPETLAQVPLPLPFDPFTGKPFFYKVESTTATFRGTAPRGEEQNPCFNVRYEVTMRK